MANIASAKKRARQMIKRRGHNASDRSFLRTEIKKVITAIEAKDKEAATNAYKTAMPIIDRMASKGIIHRNKAARHKRQLNVRLQSM